MPDVFNIIKKEKVFLVSIFMISFFMKILFFNFYINKDNNAWVCTDSSEYNSIAENLLSGNGIKKNDGDLNFRRLPGYPIFLFLCYRFSNNVNVNYVLLIQIFISSFIPLLLFFLSIVFFPKELLLAKIVSIFSIFNLGFILYSGMILSDILFLIFFLLFCLFFFSSFSFLFYSNFSYYRLIFAGIFLGVASLIRPVGQYLIFVSIILLIFSNYVFIKKLKSISIFCLGWFLVVSWWIVRNYLLTGFVFFHTLPGIHFLIYTASYIDSDLKKCEYYESRQSFLSKWDKKIKVNKIEKRDSDQDIKSCFIAEKIALKIIKKHPILFLKYSFIHMVKTVFSLHSSLLLFFDSKSLPNYTRITTIWDKAKRFLLPNVFNKTLIPIIYFEMIYNFLLLAGFFCFCLFTCFNLNQFFFDILFKVLPFIFLFIVLTLAYGCARLRLPIEPFLLILSYKFWLSLYEKRVVNAKI